MVVLHPMLGPGFLSRARTSILLGGNHLSAIPFDELAHFASAPAITLCSCDKTLNPPIFYKSFDVRGIVGTTEQYQ
jgi:hypothetical protein